MSSYQARSPEIVQYADECSTTIVIGEDISEESNSNTHYFNPEHSVYDQLDYIEIDRNFEINSSDLTITEENGKVPVAVKMPKQIPISGSHKKGINQSDALQQQQQQQRKLLKDEMKIMAYLQSSSERGHLNVLKLVGAITTNKEDFCVLTEYCEWGSLDHFLRNKFQNGNFENEIIVCTSSTKTLMKSGLETVLKMVKAIRSNKDENIYLQHTSATNNDQIWKTQQDSSWSEDFDKRRSNGQITTSDLLWFALQIAGAMQFLTEKKVLHRDVALRNVFLRSDFTLKVADFGLSRRLNNGDESYQIWNSSIALPIPYMAPESVAGGHFTIHSECWSFGVAVWELFTFAVDQPYTTELKNTDSNERFVKRLADYLASGQRLTIPSTVPNKLRELITQLWKEDPVQRPSIQSCRIILQQELTQSCPNIEVGQQIAPLHHSKLSMLNADNSKIEKIRCGPSRNQRRIIYKAFSISISIFLIVVILDRFLKEGASQVDKHIEQTLPETNSGESNSRADLATIYRKFTLTTVQFNPIQNFERKSSSFQFCFLCAIPDRYGAYFFDVSNEYHLLSQPLSVLYIGSGFIDEKVIQKNIVSVSYDLFPTNGNDWILWDIHVMDEINSNTFVLILSSLRNGRNTMISVAIANDRFDRLSTIGRHHYLRYNLTTDGSSNFAKFVESEEGTLFIVNWSIYEALSLTKFSVFNVSFYSDSSLSISLLSQRQTAEGCLFAPLIRTGLDDIFIYWLPLKPIAVANKPSAQHNQEAGSFLKVSLSDDSASTIAIANFNVCRFHNSSSFHIWNSSNQVWIHDNICYLFTFENPKEMSLCCFDFEKMTWKRPSLDWGDAVVKNNIISSSRTLGKLFIFGENESNLPYFAIIDFHGFSWQWDAEY